MYLLKRAENFVEKSQNITVLPIHCKSYFINFSVLLTCQPVWICLKKLPFMFFFKFFQVFFFFF